MIRKKASPSNLATLTQAILQFRDDRDWAQFHNPKDLAISLVLEASELLEHFQWRSDEEIKTYVREHREEIADEVADVLIYLLQLAHDLDIDVLAASGKKLAKNAKKYPVDTMRTLSKQRSYKKYTELDRG